MIDFSDQSWVDESLICHDFIDDIKRTIDEAKLCKTHATSPFKGKSHSKEAKEKMSIAASKRTGESASNYGNRHSDETKAIISEKNKKNSGVNHNCYGKPKSEETKKRISESLSARKLSDETKERMRVESTCPHCNKTGRGSAMKRYHFDNCKRKEVENG
ncbi:nuclease associated modular domain 3 protein [Vibrio phage 1.081.O._10N.286.52.C2]|nr:nuclease associated modular domain 3 protein [Vibrio phage 1.081.O._10N.286.52.C2]